MSALASKESDQKRNMKRLLAPVLCLLFVTTAHACNIPVFRYALERWRPDVCQVVVPESIKLSAREQKILDRFNETAHIQVIRSAVSTTESLNTACVVRCKIANGHQVNVWSGPIGELPKLHLDQSPARTELSHRLLKGDSVVWLMIKSSDEKKNAAARKKLTAHFDVLGKKIELPEGIGLPGSELFSDVPLLLQFSLLEIDPSDPKEAFLVKLLSGIQADAFSEGQPLLVPVFGRGRALEVIPADDLSVNLIEDLTVFLSGACSCQVKERNPGFDLLIATDWDRELFGADGEAPPDKPALQQRGGKPVLLTIPPGK